MRHAIALVLLLALAQSASAASYHMSERNVIDGNITATVTITPQRPDYSVDYVIANVSLFPKDFESQRILSLETDPKSGMDGGVLTFNWQNPRETQLKAVTSFKVQVTPWQPEVSEKVSFPLREVPAELQKYTVPTENIDSDNAEITRVASELAEGEDDLYVVVFKIANYTQRTIEYNLSTLTADVSQKASWVLRNKQGVCDELTNLFIAMLRSVGVPARFVTGEAYTESPLFPDNWGLHGWAEVYFPGYGWVPFDVTYGEFGYIDAAHIKFLDIPDSDQVVDFSTSALGRHIEIKADALSIKPEIASAEGKLQPQVRMDASPIEADVGFGSYNLIELSVENLEDYYVAIEVIAAKTQNVDMDTPIKNILLGPRERKKEYFIVKVNNGLNDKFIYTFPVAFYAPRNATASSKFTARDTSEVFSRDYFSSFAQQQGIEKTINTELSLSCSSDKKRYYAYETAVVNCTAKNLGNKMLESVAICLSKCSSFDIPISQSRSAVFRHNFTKAGPQTISVKASNYEVSRTALVKVNVSDIPKIDIIDVLIPKEVSYGEEFNITFTASKKSESAPKLVMASVLGQELSQPALEGNARFVFGLDGSQLEEGNNQVEMKVTYQDDNGRAYYETRKATIILRELNLWHRVIKFFGSLFS